MPNSVMLWKTAVDSAGTTVPAPVVNWKLNDANGAGSVADATGNGYTATPQGSFATYLGNASYPGSVGGTSWNGPGPTGSNGNFASLTASGALLGCLQNSDFTWRCWVNKNALWNTGNGYVVFWAGLFATLDQAFIVSFNDIGGTTLNFQMGSTDYWSQADPLSNGAWHLLTFTLVNGSHVGTLYVDGAQLGTHVYGNSINVASTPWNIAGHSGYGNCFYGNLWGMKMWNQALTPNQVALDYANVA